MQEQCFFCDQVKPLAGGGVVTHMLFPHDLFHMVYSRFRQEFEIHFGAKPEELERFWTQFLQTPYGKTASCRIEALQPYGTRQHNNSTTAFHSSCTATVALSLTRSQLFSYNGAGCWALDLSRSHGSLELVRCSPRDLLVAIRLQPSRARVLIAGWH